MSNSDSASARATTRARFAARFRELGSREGRAFASSVDGNDATTGRPPCWGELYRRFEDLLASRNTSTRALSIVIEEGDRRALLLVLHAARTRPTLLAALVSRASDLPVIIQRALLTVTDPESLPADTLRRFAPSAQQLAAAGPEVVAREREVVDAHIAELLSFGVVGDDSTDPRAADGGAPATHAERGPE